MGYLKDYTIITQSLFKRLARDSWGTIRIGAYLGAYLG
jgi:hypothetical protein